MKAWSRLGLRLGIRGQVLLVSLVLLLIPWVGYRYIWQVEKFLRQGQEKALAGTARAIATALHDRPQLFEPPRAERSNASRGAILYVRTLSAPIHVDGDAADWREQHAQETLVAEPTIAFDPQRSFDSTPSFVQRIGKYDQYLFALFMVRDRGVNFLSAKGGAPDDADHLEIALVAPSGEPQQFLVALREAPWTRAYRVVSTTEENQDKVALQPEWRIEAAWRESPGGYTLELRMPLAMIGPKLGFAIAKTQDDPKRQSTVLGSVYSGNAAQLPNLVIPGAEIDAILRGLGRTSSRIWVVDHLGRVLSRSGSLAPAARSDNKPAPEPLWTRLWDALETATLRQLYSAVLREPSQRFDDELAHAVQLEGKELEGAFNGALTTRWRLTSDRRALIVSAAQPVWIGDRVAGAVVVEETTNDILALRNRALEKLFNVAFAVFVFGSLTLFLFASRLSERIRALRDQAEEAIDSQGRVKSIVESSQAHDEIGDLSRSFSGMLQRLRDYTGYLEAMADRLSHELRTPVAVVRSSLDNLRHHALSSEAAVYVDRAQEGAERLSVILNRMSEATRLEQMLQSAERETFDLCAVLRGSVAGYQTANPARIFALNLPAQPVQVFGAPDLVVQMLDKLVANALDFGAENTPITIELEEAMTTARLSVSNEGPRLPEEMRGRLFESMVSVRPPTKPGAAPHLGLGLFIVRLIAEFHRGQAALVNRPDGKGVLATVTLSTLQPVAR